MTTMTLQVPDSLEKNHQDTVQFIAAKLYEAGKLSLGQTAEMAGMDKISFVQVLSNHGVSYINYTLEDVLDDLSRISKF
jgi:predicted HTH domain antitoxin